MSLSCPHCGGELVVEVRVLPGSPQLPGWRSLAQNGANDSAQSAAQTSADLRQNAHVVDSKGSEDLELQDLQTLAQNGAEWRNDADWRKPQPYPAEFQRFWVIYPRKRDKRKALAAWRRAIRRAAPEIVNAGAKRYRDDPNRLDEFTKYAEGWLNGDGWEDEPLPPRIHDRRRPPDPARPLDPALAELQIEEARRGRT